MKVRMYRIICLKRSQFATKGKDDFISDWYNNSNLVYWRSNRAGYTDKIVEAGLYFQEELEFCAGSFGDWLLEPVWKDIPEEFDQPEDDPCICKEDENNILCRWCY